MLELIDGYLNKITMYRLVLYYLILLVVQAVVLSLFKLLPYNFFDIIFSSLFLVVVCFGANELFAKVFEIPANVESVHISALILALIISPGHSLQNYVFLFWAGLLAMASKYILAIYKKHLFNPVAFSVALTAFTISKS